MSMVLEIEKLLSDYRAWLKDKTTLRELNGSWVEITTPYLDRHNDALQIYVRAENGGYILTDDSYTVHDLEASGCDLHTEKRQDLLKMTLNGYGVKLHNEALEVHATADSFPLRKHSLVQAMLSVNDLFYLAPSLWWRACFLKTWLHGWTPTKSATRPRRSSPASAGMTSYSTS